jgi:hypothetical protein
VGALGNCLNYQRQGLCPFPECRHTLGHFGGCCGNCKWRDHERQYPSEDNPPDPLDNSPSASPSRSPSPPLGSPSVGRREKGNGVAVGSPVVVQAT